MIASKQKKTIRFSWANMFPTSLDAQAVGEAISKVSGKSKTIELLLEKAKNKNHILHNSLTWDDRSGGILNRKNELRQITRMLRICMKGSDNKYRFIRAFESIPNSNRMWERGDIAIKDTKIRKDLIKKAKNELAKFNMKYSNYLAVANRISSQNSEYSILNSLVQDVESVLSRIEIIENKSLERKN